MQSLFAKVAASRSNPNENKAPATVEKSKGFRPDARRANPTSLTPNAPGNGNQKWRGKQQASPSSSLSPTAKPFVGKAAPKTDSKVPLNWRTVAQKENSQNVVPSTTPSKVPTKTPVKGVPTAESAAMEFMKSVIAARAPNTPKDPNMPTVTIESPSPSNSPVPPSPIGTPSAKKNPGSPAAVTSPKTPGSGSSPKIIDAHQIEQRKKQVDYGHQTLGYIRYRLLVPKEKRSRDDPRTPKKSQACSKRSWDGQIKKWRRDLHKWDPEDPVAFMSWLESEFVVQIIQNNIGSEILELLTKVKERASKFENSPAAMTPCTPSPSPLSPVSRMSDGPMDSVPEDLDDEKIARKLVF